MFARSGGAAERRLLCFQLAEGSHPGLPSIPTALGLSGMRLPGGAITPSRPAREKLLSEPKLRWASKP
jgi:hypothetical protein